jgi:Domain of unknown function (DUF4307)
MVPIPVPLVQILILSLTTTTPRKVLAVQIPRPAPGFARWWVVATVGIVAGCAIAIWFGLSSTVGHPSWTVQSYHVVDDRTVDVTYLVSRPTGSDVTCMVRAMDRSFGTVGLVEVHVPGSQATSVQRTTRVRTTTRAVTGVVKSCTVG